MQGRILSFFAGLCLFHGSASLPATALLLPLLALLVISASFRRTLCIAACLTGILWGWWYAHHQLGMRLPASMDGSVVTVVATITSLPEVSDERVRFRARIAHSEEQPRLAGTARLSWYAAETVPQVGELWRLRVKLRRPRGFANPAGFDYEGWLFRERLHATGYVVGKGNRRLRDAQGQQVLTRVRAVMRQRISAALDQHALLPIVLALTIGDRTGMTQAQWQSLNASGTGHLMAISGLHIGMVAGVVFLGARLCWGASQRLTRRLSATDAAIWLALLAATVYAALAAFSLPTQRALLMVAVALFALGRRRSVTPGRGLCIALMLVLVVDPLAPLSPGFWLSFGAVCAIAWAMRGYYPSFAGTAAWVRVQLAVSIGLLPLTLWQFGRVSLIAPLINLLLIPLFAFAVMPLVLTGAAMSLAFPQAGAVLLRAGADVLALVWPLLDTAAAFKPLLWSPGPRPVWTLVAALAAAALALSPLVRQQWALCAVLIVPLVAWRPAALSPGAFSLDVLDAGQGLAAVVTTRNHRLVFDTAGRFRSGTIVADLVLLPYLRGGPRPSMLVVSHADMDHRGGTQRLLAEFPELRVLAGQHLEAVAHEPCVAGHQWLWDDVRFEILHPDGAHAWADNNASCVLRVQGAGSSVLLTGDIESAAEAHLVASGAALDARVVVAPHHGSDTSSTAAFVNATGAAHVIFAAGHGNRWGFPRQKVRIRWAQAGAVIWNTGRHGAVSVRAGATADALAVTAVRSRRRHYWSP